MKKGAVVLFKILGILVPFAVSVSLFLLIIDTFKYTGFIQKHFFVNPLLIFGICVVINLLLAIFDNQKIHWWDKCFGKFLQKQSNVFWIVIGMSFLILLAFEITNYPNYVFSKFHINLDSLFYLFLAEFYLFLLPFITKTTKNLYTNTLVKGNSYLIVAILTYFSSAILFLCLPISLIEAFKYNGFIKNHFFISANEIFGIAILINYILIFIASTENYWWNTKPLKILRTQSMYLLPLVTIFYIVFWMLEFVHYPNYVYSTYHLDQTAMIRIVWIEAFIFFLPRLANVEKKYLKYVAKDLGWTQKGVGFALLALLFVCLGVRQFFPLLMMRVL